MILCIIIFPTTYYEGKEPVAFVVGYTAYGDGVYEDQNGMMYPVDAGVIGLVPLEIVDEENWELADMIPGTAEFTCEDGVFDITLPDGTYIHIDTKDEERQYTYEDEEDD